MPLYEYRCVECAERFEVLQRLGDGPEDLACPSCGADVERQLSTFAGHSGSGATARSAADCGSGFS